VEVEIGQGGGYVGDCGEHLSHVQSRHRFDRSHERNVEIGSSAAPLL
jgi:hypothetical protein